MDDLGVKILYLLRNPLSHSLSLERSVIGDNWLFPCFFGLDWAVDGKKD